MLLIMIVPHTLQVWRAMLDLSYQLCIYGITMPSVNERSQNVIPLDKLDQMEETLLCIIEIVINAPEEDGDVVF